MLLTGFDSPQSNRPRPSTPSWTPDCVNLDIHRSIEGVRIRRGEEVAGIECWMELNGKGSTGCLAVGNDANAKGLGLFGAYFYGRRAKVGTLSVDGNMVGEVRWLGVLDRRDDSDTLGCCGARSFIFEWQGNDDRATLSDEIIGKRRAGEGAERHRQQKDSSSEKGFDHLKASDSQPPRHRRGERRAFIAPKTTTERTPPPSLVVRAAFGSFDRLAPRLLLLTLGKAPHPHRSAEGLALVPSQSMAYRRRAYSSSQSASLESKLERPLYQPCRALQGGSR